jgi:hypothetical protein
MAMELCLNDGCASASRRCLVMMHWHEKPVERYAPILEAIGCNMDSFRGMKVRQETL